MSPEFLLRLLLGFMEGTDAAEDILKIA